MIRVLSIIALCFSLIGCNKSGTETSDVVKELTLGDIKLSIPKKYLLPRLPTSIVPKEKNLDVDISVLVEIPIAELGVSTNSHDGLANKIIVLISNLSNQASPGALSAWNGTDLFIDRIIEFDDEVNLYRVYPKAGYPIMWQYFKTSPIDGGDFLSSWISSCTSPPGTDGKNLSKVKCQIINRYKAVESQITLNGENMKLIDAISSGYLKLMTSWEVKKTN